VKTYDSVFDFWDDCLGPLAGYGAEKRIFAGDIVRFEKAVIHEWAPRAAGVFFSKGDTLFQAELFSRWREIKSQ
jgi:hypothetical protein